MLFFRKIPQTGIIIFMLLICSKSKAQDLAMTPPTASPNSGCMLSSTETVQIVVFNAGSDIFTPFDISYTINGGPPVTETYPLPTFPSSSTYTVTFPFAADLSGFGTYTVCYYTTFAGETNFSNDTICEIIINDSLTNPGVLLSDTLVCSGANTGTLDLVGTSDNIVNWHISNNSGGLWFSLANQTTAQAYSNLGNETCFRVILQNGFCLADTSNIVCVGIFPNNYGVSNDTSIIEGSSASLSAYGGLSYVWSPGIDLDDSLLQAPLATPLLTTTYVVEITDVNSCIYYDSVLVTVDPFNDLPLDTNNDKVFIFPNPATNKLVVSGLKEVTEYQIIDLQGRIQQKGKTNKNILFDLPKGVYLIGFEGFIPKKLIVRQQ